jgi:predicted enzyme related to lactoylglutathione lyase
MPRIVHFEIPTDDPERASKFYNQVFDWNINKWDGPQDYWLAETGTNGEPGINGGLMRRIPEFPTVTNTIGVDSVDEYTRKITENGGTIVAPKMPIPGMGWLAYFKDTEGNTFGIMQPDSEAA